jgi:hypothetical protein
MKKFLFVIILMFPSLLSHCQERHIVVAADGTGEFTTV